MPVMMPATLAPREALSSIGTAGARARVGLSAAGPVGARAREALSSAGAAGARARDALSAAGAAGARAREALSALGAGWSRRMRLERQRLRDLRLHPHDLSLFSSNKFHIYRLDGRVVGAWPTPRWEWVPLGRGRPDRLGAGRLDSLHLPPFKLPPVYQNVPTPPNLHFTHMDINQAYASGKRSPSAGASASGASSAIGAGAAVLALAALVLLARAFERCLDQRLFKLLRRRSSEWFIPNVLATSRQEGEEGIEAGLEGSDVPPLPPGDPPPPYSMCLPKSPQAPGSAEPPPPYSACYVAFGGPHDLPRVHLNVPTPHLFQDTGQISESEVTHNSDVSVTTELARGSRDEGVNIDPYELRPNREGVVSQGDTVNLVA